MLPQTPTEEFEAELTRVLTRLRSMPIHKLSEVQEIFAALSTALLEHTTALGDVAPVALPVIEPRSYADVIAVLAQDVRKVANDETQLVPATSALTQARRALP
jgi:hypothetical protein